MGHPFDLLGEGPLGAQQRHRLRAQPSWPFPDRSLGGRLCGVVPGEATRREWWNHPETQKLHPFRFGPGSVHRRCDHPIAASATPEFLCGNRQRPIRCVDLSSDSRKLHRRRAAQHPHPGLVAHRRHCRTLNSSSTRSLAACRTRRRITKLCSSHTSRILALRL